MAEEQRSVLTRGAFASAIHYLYLLANRRFGNARKGQKIGGPVWAVYRFAAIGGCSRGDGAYFLGEPPISPNTGGRPLIAGQGDPLPC